MEAGVPRGKRVRIGLIVVACGVYGAYGVGFPPAGAIAQGPPPVVTAVEVRGLERDSSAFVQELIRVRAGDALDETALEAAVSRLLRTGRFLAASYRVEEVEGGVRVVFDVAERPQIVSIRFEGNEKFSDRQLRTEMAMKPGDPLDRFAIRNAVASIEAKYRGEGYPDVVVKVDEALLEDTGALTLRIEEGPRTRIREIVFEGNATLGDRQLKKHVGTKAAFSIFRSGAFEQDQVERDVAAIQNHYRDEGFLDARVGYRRETTDDGEDLRVVFTVVEGARYVIEEIEFRGNTVFSDGELDAMTASRVGETVRRPTIERDARSLQERYGELGYIYVTVRPSRVFSSNAGFVRLTLEIDEGEQYRVSRVTVRGNTSTKDKVVRRALNLYPPDDLFNLTEARNAERRLVESTIFSSARVHAVGDEPGRREAVIDVQEATRTGDFLFGFGVTSNSGLIGNIVLDVKNFDLFDPPRTVAELIKFQSFYGGGQRFRLELQPGTDISRFRIDFTEPYLFDRPLRLDTGLYLFDRGRDGYIEERAGGTISLGKRFERGRLHGWSGELALRVEDLGLRDLDLFAAREIREDEGSSLLTSLKLTFVRDRTDSRFVATRGDRARLGYEQHGVFGGDHFFGRLTGAYTWYKTLRVDPSDRKSVLKLSAEAGAIIGDAPVPERFYAGGTGSLRGFQFRGIGRREGLEDNNVGGDYRVLMSSEYSFPLFGDNMRGLFFLDTGTVGSGTWRASIGTGVRLTINLFGPVPLEFALGFPFLSDSDDDIRVFSFSVGGLF